MRKNFHLSDEQFENLLDACKPVPCMKIGDYLPSSPQENANRAWQKLGREMGFEWETVRPNGNDMKDFTAEELEE